MAISLAPGGIQGIVMDYIGEETDILVNNIEEAGLDPTIQQTYSGKQLFAAGQADFETISTIESSALASEREMPLSITSKLAPMFGSLYVRTGERYDPEVSGSPKASIDRLVEDQALVGIISWATGGIPIYQVLLEAGYDYQFTRDGDFNIQVTDPATIGKLTVEGDLAACDGTPVHGLSPYLVPRDDPQLTPIWPSAAEKLNELGYGTPQLNNWITTADYHSNHPGATRALLESWREGMDWFMSKPKEIVTETESRMEQLGVTSEQQARFVIDWGINLDYENTTPIVYQDVTMSDEFIEEDKKFLDEAANFGSVPENWSDWIQYEQVDLS